VDRDDFVRPINELGLTLKRHANNEIMGRID
jgi:hypothetical protein